VQRSTVILGDGRHGSIRRTCGKYLRHVRSTNDTVLLINVFRPQIDLITSPHSPAASVNITVKDCIDKLLQQTSVHSHFHNYTQTQTDEHRQTETRFLAETYLPVTKRTWFVKQSNTVDITKLSTSLLLALLTNDLT